jgi:hypothetical protein
MDQKIKNLIQYWSSKFLRKRVEYLKNFKSLYSFPKYFSFPFFQPKNSLNFIFFKFERIKKLSLDKNARNLFKNNNKMIKSFLIQ